MVNYNGNFTANFTGAYASYLTGSSSIFEDLRFNRLPYNVKTFWIMVRFFITIDCFIMLKRSGLW